MSQDESSDEIRKLTPLERAIAERKDRRRRWDAKKEQEGFKRVFLWVPEDRVEELKAFARRLTDTATR